MKNLGKTVVLASGSKTRAKLLSNAGIFFKVDPAKIDEENIIESMESKKETPSTIVQALADFKALNRSEAWPNAMVIGADQVLFYDGKIFTKPKTNSEARKTLKVLSGNTHELITAASAALNGIIVWRHISKAKMTMRILSNEFLNEYVESLSSELGDSVGAYKIEKEGAQLFKEIKGDFFCILGLPLLPLLNYFRDNKILKN